MTPGLSKNLTKGFREKQRTNRYGFSKILTYTVCIQQTPYKRIHPEQLTTGCSNVLTNGFSKIMTRKINKVLTEWFSKTLSFGFSNILTKGFRKVRQNPDIFGKVLAKRFTTIQTKGSNKTLSKELSKPWQTDSAESSRIHLNKILPAKSW